jgi:hypothetical protein
MRSRGDKQASRTVAEGIATAAAADMKELLSVIPSKGVANVLPAADVVLLPSEYTSRGAENKGKAFLVA